MLMISSSSRLLLDLYTIREASGFLSGQDTLWEYVGKKVCGRQIYEALLYTC